MDAEKQRRRQNDEQHRDRGPRKRPLRSCATLRPEKDPMGGANNACSRPPAEFRRRKLSSESHDPRTRYFPGGVTLVGVGIFTFDGNSTPSAPNATALAKSFPFVA